MKTTKKKNEIIKNIGFVAALMLVTQKIAFSVGDFQVQITLFLYPILIGMCFFYRKIYIKKSLLIGYFALLVMVFFSLLLESSYKLTSLVYFVFIYLFFIFEYKFTIPEREYLKSIIINILLITALIGIIQFCLQLFGLSYIDIFDYIPNFTLSGFNTYYPISYGATIIKSNGWIYLEPSFFSQFMALGIIIILYGESLEKKQLIQIALLFIGLITSFSGTGILLLIVFSIPFMKRLNLKKLFPLVIIGLIILFVFTNSNYSSSIISRIFEYRSSNSSASIRFINPFVKSFGETNTHFFIGNGPGAVSTVDKDANFSVIPKMEYEYGIFTTIVFLTFILKKLLFNKRYNLVSFAIVFMYLFLAGNLLQPVIVFNLIMINEAVGYKPTR